jgi:oligoendopeptidase F
VQISKEELDYRFDIVFGLKARKIEDEFMYSIQLILGRTGLLEEKGEIKSFDELLLLIEFLNDKLMQIWRDTPVSIDTSNPVWAKIVQECQEYFAEFKKNDSI